jgi:hypothetical protein
MPFRAAVCLVAVASLSLTAGCLGIPAVYAYPKISHFPATDLNAGGTEVEAFLVKKTKVFQDPPCRLTEREEVTRLSLPADSNSVSHTSVTFEAFAGFLGPICYGSHVWHELEIVLYRPGYERVVIRPWERGKTIDWKPAASIAVVADECGGLAGMSDDCERLRTKAASFQMR